MELKAYKKRKRWDAILDRIPEGIQIIGCEIGVLNGNTAARLLAERHGLTHHMIDPWDCPEPGSSYDLTNDTNSQKPKAEHEKAYQTTLQRVKKFGDRAIICRALSHDIVKKFKDGCFDFIFIDGDHSYEGVKRDITNYLPKVQKGGWIGGHDYNHPRLEGVKPAVDELFGAENLELDDDRTWFFRVK